MIKKNKQKKFKLSINENNDQEKKNNITWNQIINHGIEWLGKTKNNKKR